ncbi:8410_t:CDS:2 [Diversispora eburnea]|uniref:8410_t:CDS:1 n=1 Tax=Diversispora eburnea TaxID=1213867 RepID=A0A9N8W1A8_9GLOM|nr:8410_t:CDS:2 [Diversispora eburnea]
MSSSFLPAGRNVQIKFNPDNRNSDVLINSLSDKAVSKTTPPAIIPSTTESHASHSFKFTGSHAFAHKSQKLLSLLRDTKSILGSYREVNKEKWHIQYPFIRFKAQSSTERIFPKDDNNLRSISERITMKAEPLNKFREQIRAKLHAPEPDMSSSQESINKLNVLNLDLKKGDRSSAENVVEKLDKSSVATLLDERIIQSIKRIENLSSRVADTSSKVLVAGDVNAGKSTFVNALLRREIMPVDQQPCTTIFCEVLNVQENSNKEEIHAIKNIEAYNREDKNTYTKIDFVNLFDTISGGTEEYTQLKVYCKDKRKAQQSLLHNGVVDIALIDCPGLNRDTLKTTALFARQEEIDVIVFVVSAENHFTLSAKEFLSNASNEKAYLFIVVNRFDNIRDKNKCKRNILEQIKEVSPRTHEHSEDLVHFVTSTAIPIETDNDESISESPASPHTSDRQRIEDFQSLEESLRNFILKKRSKSKLAPAQYYLENLVSDIGVLAEFNRSIASIEAKTALKELQDGERSFEQLCNDEKYIGAKAEKYVEETCDLIVRFTKQRLEHAISEIDKSVINIEYPGLVYAWAFANDVRDIMLDEISKEVRLSEEFAKKETALCISKIQSSGENLEGNQRQIKLDKMYKRDHNIISNAITVSLSDFVDLNFDKNVNDGLSIIGFSGCTLIAVATRLDAFSSLWKITNFIGFNNLRKIALPMILIAGGISVAYVIRDLKRSLTRNLARKIQQQLAQSQYVDIETNRIVRQGRKKLRLATDDLRTRFRHAVEEEEKKRIVTKSILAKSEEAARFFEEIFSKVESMADTLETLGHEWEDMDD